MEYLIAWFKLCRWSLAVAVLNAPVWSSAATIDQPAMVSVTLDDSNVVGASGTTDRLLRPAGQNNGWMMVEGTLRTNHALSLEASSDLKSWTSIALLDFRVFNPENGEIESARDQFRYYDPAGTNFDQRFYRFTAKPVTESNDWKNQIVFYHDLFTEGQIATDSGQMRWAKFAIVLSDSNRVFYQDSVKYPLHHDFASRRLTPFAGMDRVAFDQASLFTNGQQVLLGSVLFPPRKDIPEYGIQFAGREPYPRETIRRFFDLARSTVIAPTGAAAFYFPAYEQSEAAAMDEAYLASYGIAVSSPNRWIDGNQVYSAGWALGRVKQIPAGQIDAAYASGQLRPEDILLTDGVPAEIPFVAGIVTTTPATPNSHVAILANGYGIPFVYAAEGLLKDRLMTLTNQEVVLQAVLKAGSPLITLIPVNSSMSGDLRAEILALKAPPTPTITPMASFGEYSANTLRLTVPEVKYFGGKAANYGLLSRTLPTNSQPAVAFSFDLWTEFMAQTLPNGKSLLAEIHDRLADYRYPPNLVSLKTNLAAVRQLITKSARFSDPQKQAITNALAGFDPLIKIRFRSSSNAEDNKNFSAAGLYDSYSGCLADDLDNDEAGPSRADPADPDERGVFRAMQKVYASFFNDNAFLERLRHRIDEAGVGMAILAHYSTPDSVELANGVGKAYLEPARFGGPSWRLQLVTQKGAVSVANPEGNAKPEISQADEYGGVSLIQPSSLVPLGGHVMAWEDDYSQLAQMLYRVYRDYPRSAADSAQTLEFEYKKVAPGQLMVKQVREYPEVASVSTNRYLLNEPTTYWIYQSESSDVIANHRLKGFLKLENRNTKLDPASIGSPPMYSLIELAYRDGSTVTNLSLRPEFASGVFQKVSSDPRLGLVVVTDWHMRFGTNSNHYEFTSTIPSTTATFLPQADLRKKLLVTYSEPQPTFDGWDVPTTTKTEEVQWVAAPDLDSLKDGDTIGFTYSNKLTFQVVLQQPQRTEGPTLGVDLNAWGTYPAAFSPWMHSRIAGITAEPLVLRDYYSQSAKPGHKYRYDWYLFEPLAEPGLPESQRQELIGKNIQWIYVSREAWPGGKVNMMILGLDGKFRKWE